VVKGSAAGTSSASASTSAPAPPDGAVVSETGDEAVLQGIGAAIRAHRTAAGLSMRELAARAGMSQPFLSNLENARAMPSVATLYRLANALGTGPHEFLPSQTHPVVVVRHGEGLRSPVDDTPGAPDSVLVAGAPGRMIEAHTFDVGPGVAIGDWFEHDGEDFVMVVEGRLVVEFGDGRVHELAAGDTMWHVSEIAHRWRTPADSGARVLLVNARQVAPVRTGAHGTDLAR
jgi:quercetin dioxygenase-like cupin family protein/lambda repressor-like predicted transcriptional regulator